MTGNTDQDEQASTEGGSVLKSWSSLPSYQYLPAVKLVMDVGEGL